MAIYQNQIFAGGQFSLAPVKNIHDFTRFDGVDFQSTDPQFSVSGPCFIQKLIVYKGELYVGGYFQKAGGYTGDFIMKYDGNQFTEVSGGTDGRVMDMVVYGDNLYVVGNFLNVNNGAIPSKYIARWDGSQWYSMNTDTISPSWAWVRTVAILNDTLYLGGNFKAIQSDQLMKGVARYKYAVSSIDETELTTGNIKVCPNPASNKFTISASQNNNYAFEIYNSLGKIIFSNTFKQTTEINTSSWQSGIYFIRVTDGKNIWNEKIIKQ
jgi:hypothetical protein